MSAGDLIDSMLVRQSKPTLIQAAMQATIRPHLAGAIDLDLYSLKERGLPVIQARWTVARFEWRGQQWRRVRKLCGPKTFEDAMRELEFQMRRHGLPRIADA